VPVDYRTARNLSKYYLDGNYIKFRLWFHTTLVMVKNIYSKDVRRPYINPIATVNRRGYTIKGE